MKKVALLIGVCLLAAMLFPRSNARADNLFGFLFGGKQVGGSGQLVTESRTLEPFEEIELAGAFDVNVRIGPEQKVELTFDDNLIDLIRMRVEGHSLRIFSEGSYSSDHNCRVDITVPSLESISCSGSGEIELGGLDQDSFAYALSGSGGFRAEGKVKKLDVAVSGSGEVDTRDLVASEVRCAVSGSGSVRVYAGESFDGNVSGSGDIWFWGDPEHVSSHVSGSGQIHRKRR